MITNITMHCETCDEDFKPEKIYNRAGDVVLCGTHEKCGVSQEEVYEFVDRFIVV
jgi:hypothetical protein